MKISLIVMGILVAVVLIVVVIGYSLPVKHQVSREAILPATPAQVYGAITNVGAFPKWRSRVTSVDVLPSVNGKRSFLERGSDGAILFVVDDEVPDRRLVTRIADPSLPFGGTWTFEITPATSGTTLRITEDGDVYNPIFRFMSRFVFGHSASIDGYVADLKKHLAATG